MPILRWALFEMTSYGVGPWLAFMAVAVLAARTLGGPGVVLGHLLIAGAVIALDIRWAQSAIRKPGWDPNAGPDLDFVFMFASLVRALLVNTALLPVSILVLRSRRRPANRSAA